MERGTKLRQLRRLKDLSQDYIAIQLETSQKQISRFETGKKHPRIDLLDKWCKLLGITIRKLEKLCGNP